jgi:hypothetical protein
VTARRAAAALAAALACGAPGPDPLPRIVGAAPAGAGVSTAAAAWVAFSAPVDPAGLLDGRRLVLAEAIALRDALRAVEGDGGAPPGFVPARAALADGGRRVVLRPEAPLRARTGHVLVLSSLVRAADGRAVLDPEGRRRPFVAPFETGAPEGPPAAPVLTEVRADAATPEAGGEYVEVANLGEGPLDLRGWRLGKRTAAGALAWCTVAAPADAAVPPGGVALLAGGAWDGRYPLPAGVPVLACGAAALLGGIANDRPPDLLLADPAGAAAATLGARGAPPCAAALERRDPAGPDEPWNLACTEGSPGRY